MLDLSHLANKTNDDIQVFYANSSVNLTWYTWRKPRGCKFVQFIAISGGGAGGDGNGSGWESGGGGGGGSGNFTIITLPLWAIPDILYVKVGTGGLPNGDGAQNAGFPYYTTGGGAGSETWISLALNDTDIPARNNLFVYLKGGLGGGIGGSNLTTFAGGSGGYSQITYTLDYAPLAGLALGSAFGGISNQNNYGNYTFGGSGGIGGTPPGKDTSNLVSAVMIQGGAGGGAVGYGSNTPSIPNGGSIPSLNTLFPGVAGGLGGTTGYYGGTGNMLNGNPGSSGYQPVPGLFYFCGGSGGGGGANYSSGAGVVGSTGVGGVGGNGGNGAYGCGGGGGGAGYGVGAGGKGGRGGDGLVVSISW